MKKIVYLLLIFFLFSCLNIKEQPNKESQNQEIMLERERIIKIIQDKENYVQNFNNFNNRRNPKDSEREADISQCTKVTKRFFINGKENNNFVSYYDKNGNFVLGISYDENGEEQSRSIKKYNEKNEIIESSYWWGGRVRESLIIIEKSFENDRIIYRMKESKYNENFQLISERVCKNNGNLISEIDFDEDTFFSYKIYNDKNDVVFYGYNHEKSDGDEEEKYDIEYDSHFNKIKIKTYENENLIYETVNNFSKKNKLIKSVKTNLIKNTKTTELFTYDKKNNLIEDKLLDDNDKEIFVKYYKYDNKNRKIKEGERRGNTDRYSLYEYSEIEKETKPIKGNIEEKNIFEPEKHNDGRIWIEKYELDKMGLQTPASLREISECLTEKNKNIVTSIRIDNGKNITTLDGIELFPALEYLSIYNSKIKNLNNIQKKYLNIKRLLIESNEMEDISNIVLFENIEVLDLLGLEKIKSFPDITHLKKLWSLSLYNLKEIKLNNLAVKIPIELQIIDLRDCNINSLEEISNFFKRKIRLFDLSNNPIKEINFNMDYGAAEYIYMPNCPVSDKYFKWDKDESEGYPGKVRNAKGVIFAFGYYEEGWWVKEE